MLRRLPWMAIVALTLVALSTTAFGQGSEPNAVKVGFTPFNAEIKELLAIKQSDTENGRAVIMRLEDPALPGFGPQNRLESMSEVQVTTDCNVDQNTPPNPTCIHPYNYAPHVKARLILTRNANAVGAEGGGAVGIDTRELQCGHTEHHCMFVFRNLANDIDDDNNPCRFSDHCYINVVVNAWHSDAEADGDDKLLIGGNEPNGSVEQNKSSVGVVRIKPAVPAGEPIAASGQGPSDYPITDGQVGDRHRIYSVNIGAPSANTQFSFDFNIDVRPSVNVPIRVSTQALVSRSLDPDDVVSNGAITSDGKVTRFNGENCLGGGPCTVRKVGVFRAEGNFEENLNLLIVAKSEAPFDNVGGGHVDLSDANLEVERYAANLFG